MNRQLITYKSILPVQTNPTISIIIESLKRILDLIEGLLKNE